MLVAGYILIEHVCLNATENVSAIEVGQLLCRQIHAQCSETARSGALKCRKLLLENDNRTTYINRGVMKAKTVKYDNIAVLSATVATTRRTLTVTTSAADARIMYGAFAIRTIYHRGRFVAIASLLSGRRLYGIDTTHYRCRASMV